MTDTLDRATAKKTVYLPQAGHNAHFFHRDTMRRKTAIDSFRLPKGVPATQLPVDSFGPKPPTFNMDDNDTYGICGPALCDHVDVIYAWRQGTGTQLSSNVQALLAQYLKASGGDNGTDEDMLVGAGGIWTAAGGGLEGDPTKIVDDHLDIDFTDPVTLQYAIDQFYAVAMAWSVPDQFLQEFAPGSKWVSAMTPNPDNGHYSPLANVDATGLYTLITWGATCTVSQPFVSSVQPSGFVAFSRQQFNAAGYDSKGRHVSTQAAKWVACGGSAAIASKVVALFPPATPTPSPLPPAPAPEPAPAPAVYTGSTAPTTIKVEVPIGPFGLKSAPVEVQIPALPVTVSAASAVPGPRLEYDCAEVYRPRRYAIRTAGGPLANLVLEPIRRQHLVAELLAAGYPTAVHDVPAALGSGDWSQILTWVLTNAPQILAFVESIIALFGA